MQKTIFLFLLFFIVSSCDDKEVVEKPIKPVRYIVVGDILKNSNRTFTGETVAGNEIDLSFRSSGIIIDLPISTGDEVKKGDLIARLDNVQAKLAYEKALSSLNSAKSEMNTENSNLERVKNMYEKGSNSLRDYEKAKNSYQTALDNYETAKRNLSIQKSQISYGVIYAPIEGVITNVDGGINETASPGEVIATLNGGDEINVEIGIPESIINKFQLDVEAKISIPSLNKNYIGRVIQVSPSTDENFANYKVKVNLPVKMEEIKLGMIADVTFNFDDSNSTNNEIIIPINAVGKDVNGNFVFIIEEVKDGIGVAKKKSVKLGDLTENGFIVLEGLKDSDYVCTAGLQTLLDGQRVKIN